MEMLSAEKGAADNTRQAYARDLDDFAAFIATRRRKPLAAVQPADISAYLRAAAEAGPRSGLARAAPVGHPPAVQVPRCRGRRRGGPRRPPRRPEARAPSAPHAVRGRGRSPDRDRAPAHRRHHGPRARARAPALRPDRDALRHRHAGQRAGDAAALGPGRRRPRAAHQGQGRTRAHRAAQRGGAGRARPLSERRLRGRRGADGEDAGGCSPRAAPRGT